MKTFVEGVTIWLIFIFAAAMDGQLDSIERIRQFRMDVDMALLWAIQTGLEQLTWV